MPCRSPIRCVCLLQHLIALDITVATCLHMLLLCACRCLLSSRSPARIDGMAPACALTAEPVGIASDVVRLRSDTIELSAYCLLDPLHAVLSSPQPRCFCAPARAACGALVARVLCAAPLVLARVRHARRSAACFRRLLRARSMRVHSQKENGSCRVACFRYTRVYARAHSAAVHTVSASLPACSCFASAIAHATPRHARETAPRSGHAFHAMHTGSTHGTGNKKRLNENRGPTA